MDSCVHIWKFERPAAAAAGAGADGDAGGEGDDEEEEVTKLIEYSCGGYMTKV
jgi:hypothetical protein